MADSFRFKQFEVANVRSAQKVGTDGVLLGAWVALKATDRRILDVGTGTGVIALMMAQRASDALITAIDIDTESVAEATDNFLASPWQERLLAMEAPFQQMPGEYDLIISNPPFFIDSLKAPDDRRSAARHTDTLPHRDIISGAARLLSPQGRLAVIYPATEAEMFAGEALSAGLFPERICKVSTKAGAAPKRFLMELSREKKEPLIEELSIMSGGDYTAEYKSLTSDFYLKF